MAGYSISQVAERFGVEPHTLRFYEKEGILRCGNRSERLSGREFQVMELFMRAPRAIVSAERIMERIWGWESDAEINVVWVHISNLRKKLAVVGSSVVIRVSRGLGYSLEEGK